MFKFVAILVAISFSTHAYAQTRVDGSATSAPSAPSDPKFVQKKRTDANGKPITVIDFEDANIEGQAKAPSGFVLQSRESSSFRNLIELRRNFRPQIEATQFAVSAQ